MFIRNPNRLHQPRLSALVVAVGFGLALTMPSLSAGVGDDPLEEYQVKAAFLYNFAKFVQWPAGAFRDSSDPIVICILGEDPFGRSLEDTVAGRKVDGRTLTVRHISSIRQSPHCHVLFVSSAEQRKSAPDFDQIRSPGILTIGESGTSAPYGSVINFKLESGKVRFDINVEAAEREKLKISSRLLSLGHVVDPRK